MTLRAILLDLDGTLVDTNAHHTEAHRRAMEACGYSVDAERIARAVGMGGDKLVPELIGDEGERAHGDAIRSRAGELFTEVFAREHRFELFPAVEALIEDLRQRGMRLAIATSSDEGFLDAIFRSAGTDLRPRVHAVTTKSDVDESKPSADVVLAALDALGVAPEEALLVGDTIYDFHAASRAGVAGIGVATWVWSEDELVAAGASGAYASPAALLADLDRVLAKGDPAAR
jgi:HAD superfamily hydrolase (TIGR01549 family)